MFLLKLLIALITAHLGMGAVQTAAYYWGSDTAYYGDSGLLSHTPIGSLTEDYSDRDRPGLENPTGILRTLISAFHERFEQEEILARTRNLPVYEHDTMIAPGEKKGLILEELGLLNFNRETLYPSLDEVADRITQRYQ